MGRHDQQKRAVLSPRTVERATTSHFKTLFQDPSPSQARTWMKGLKRVPFKTPNVNQSTCTVRMISIEANPVHLRTTIHNRNNKWVPFKTLKWQVLERKNKLISRPSFKTLERTNGMYAKLSSFQDPLSRPLIRSITQRVKQLNSKYYIPTNKQTKIVSEPVTALREQLQDESAVAPLQASRFNPFYVEPGSIQINSTKDLQTLYPNSFDQIGDMSGEYDIKIDPHVPPVQHGRCKVHIEYKAEIEKELNDMVCQGIIVKQTELTPWVSSLTYPKKPNNKLRFVLIQRIWTKQLSEKTIKHRLWKIWPMSWQEQQNSPKWIETRHFWNTPHRASVTAHNVQHAPQ